MNLPNFIIITFIWHKGEILFSQLYSLLLIPPFRSLMPNFKSFWFYFNSIPLAFSLLFFSINLLVYWSSDYVTPTFDNAVIQCKDISNDRWVEDSRTYQDKCVDEFMGEKSFMTTISELLWVLGLLISIVGIAFIIPLSVYLLLSWRKHRNSHY